MPRGSLLHPEVTLTSKESDGLAQAAMHHKRTPAEHSGEGRTSTNIALTAHLAQVLPPPRDQDQGFKSLEKSMRAGHIQWYCLEH